MRTAGSINQFLVARFLKRFQVRHWYYFEPGILQNSLSHISQFRVFRDNENGTSWLLWGHNPKVLQKLKAEFDTEHLVNDSGKCWSLGGMKRKSRRLLFGFALPFNLLGSTPDTLLDCRLQFFWAHFTTGLFSKVLPITLATSRCAMRWEA